MGDQQQFKVKSDSQPVHSQMWNLQVSRCYTDVWLFCCETLLPAHRIVLAANSPYFKRLFDAVTPAVAGPPVIILPRAGAEAMTALLEYMYTGETTVNKELLPVLLKFAVHFEMPELQTAGKAAFDRAGEQTQEESVVASTTRAASPDSRESQAKGKKRKGKHRKDRDHAESRSKMAKDGRHDEEDHDSGDSVDEKRRKKGKEEANGSPGPSSSHAAHLNDHDGDNDGDGNHVHDVAPHVETDEVNSTIPEPEVPMDIQHEPNGVDDSRPGSPHSEPSNAVAADTHSLEAEAGTSAEKPAAEEDEEKKKKKKKDEGTHIVIEGQSIRVPKTVVLPPEGKLERQGFCLWTGSTVEDGNTKNLFFCSRCKFSNRLRTAAIAHEKGHVRKCAFICPSCLWGFTEESELKDHVRKLHSEDPAKEEREKSEKEVEPDGHDADIILD